jgi:hypothetical protein
MINAARQLFPSGPRQLTGPINPVLTNHNSSSQNLLDIQDLSERSSPQELPKNAPSQKSMIDQLSSYERINELTHQ